MATTAQEHLDLINEVITKRLNGDGYEQYSTSQRRFFGTPLEELYSIRRELKQEVNADSGGTFRLGVPFE
jgi:hypothetical protein